MSALTGQTRLLPSCLRGFLLHIGDLSYASPMLYSVAVCPLHAAITRSSQAAGPKLTHLARLRDVALSWGGTKTEAQDPLSGADERDPQT